MTTRQTPFDPMEQHFITLNAYDDVLLLRPDRSSQADQTMLEAAKSCD